MCVKVGELMENNMGSKKYKPSKTISEQIEYLKTNKNVVFNDISEEEAKDILLKYNYINVITPFKHRFAKLDSKKQVIKDDRGNHIYENQVDFAQYYECFLNERGKYPTIIKAILNFEIHFKSILAYHVFMKYKLTDAQELSSFLESLKLNLIGLHYSNARIKHMADHMDSLKKDVTKYADKYCFFDRMSLGSVLTVFSCLDRKMQQNIFDDMKKYQLNFDVDKISDFKEKIFTLVNIRNCVMHDNSIEILFRFYNPKTHELRKVSDRKKYQKVLKWIEKNHG